MWFKSLLDAVINFGPTVGFRNFFLSEDAFDDGQFLPVAAAARLKLFGILTGGADVNTDLNAYVTERAIKGLFMLVEKE